MIAATAIMPQPHPILMRNPSQTPGDVNPQPKKYKIHTIDASLRSLLFRKLHFIRVSVYLTTFSQMKNLRQVLNFSSLMDHGQWLGLTNSHPITEVR